MCVASTGRGSPFISLGSFVVCAGVHSAHVYAGVCVCVCNVWVLMWCVWVSLMLCTCVLRDEFIQLFHIWQCALHIRQCVLHQ